ncbi:MAG TPA: hypothetical protein VFB06_06465 [Streptosporangiaceae bacterium]|nr:hypothetical protein [Streptosporangiaceae bacterium]
MVTEPRSLRSDDPQARDLAAAVKGGDAERLAAMLAADPSLATCLVTEEGRPGASPAGPRMTVPGAVAQRPRAHAYET